MAPAAHRMVLGRFSLAGAGDQPMPTSGLKLQLTLFGVAASTEKWPANGAAA